MMGDRDGQVSAGHCFSCERAVPLAAANATHCYSGATVLATPFPPIHLSHCSLGGLTPAPLASFCPLVAFPLCQALAAQCHPHYCLAYHPWFPITKSGCLQPLDTFIPQSYGLALPQAAILMSLFPHS